MASNCTYSNQTVSTEMTLENYVFIFVNSFLMIFICCGNVLTIIAVWKTPVLRTVPNMYVVSLAVADLLAGMVLPLQILNFIPSIKLILDHEKYFCLFRHVTFFVSVTASVLSLVTIAFDRALYIGYPLKYQLYATVRKAYIFIATTWCLSLILGTIPLYDNFWTPCSNCSIFIVLSRRFQVDIMGSSFIVCCILTACCYGYILYTAKKHQAKILKLEIYPSNQTQKAKDFKLIKLFGLVFGIFFVCWVPAFVSVIVGHLGGHVPQIVTNITVPLAILNSGMNFIVYGVKNKDFQRAFVKILCFKRVKENLVGPTVINVSGT